VIERAQTWVDENVPYSQTNWWSDRNGKYRTDCSGYVSMAWHLDQGTNYWTGNLAVVSQRITPIDPLESDPLKVDLLKGDILLSASHTVIFEEWADPGHTAFYLYEVAHPGTTARRVIGSVDYYRQEGFLPYRYNGIVDAGDPLLVPAVLATPAPPMLELLGPLELPWTGGRQGWSRLERLDTGEFVDQTVPVAFSAQPGPQPAALIAAAIAGLFACAFPMTALTAPLRRTTRRH